MEGHGTLRLSFPLVDTDTLVELRQVSSWSPFPIRNWGVGQDTPAKPYTCPVCDPAPTGAVPAFALPHLLPH